MECTYVTNACIRTYVRTVSISQSPVNYRRNKITNKTRNLAWVAFNKKVLAICHPQPPPKYGMGRKKFEIPES